MRKLTVRDTPTFDSAQSITAGLECLAEGPQQASRHVVEPVGTDGDRGRDSIDRRHRRDSCGEIFRPVRWFAEPGRTRGDEFDYVAVAASPTEGWCVEQENGAETGAQQLALSYLVDHHIDDLASRRIVLHVFGQSDEADQDHRQPFHAEAG